MKSDLTEIVTGTLRFSEKPSLGKSPQKILLEERRRRLDPPDLLPYVEDAKIAAKGQGGIWKSASQLAALCESNWILEPDDGCLVFLLDAHDADQGDPRAKKRHEERVLNMEKELEEIIYDEHRGDVLWGWGGYIEFLDSIWKSNTPTILSRITGASTNTAKKWIKGGGALDRNIRCVEGAATIFYDLYYRLEWEEDRIRSWAESPIKNSKDFPLDFFRTNRHSKKLSAELSRIGLVKD